MHGRGPVGDDALDVARNDGFVDRVDAYESALAGRRFLLLSRSERQLSRKPTFRDELTLLVFHPGQIHPLTEEKEIAEFFSHEHCGSRT